MDKEMEKIFTERMGEFYHNGETDCLEQIELHEPFVNDRIYSAADGGSQNLRAIVFSNAKKLYWEILPAEVSVRIEKELSGICEAGYDPILLLGTVK